MTIYEIDQKILELIDPETGELTDESAFAELQMNRAQKIENIALWIKNLESDINELFAEREKLFKRAEAKQKKIESLKKLLAFATDCKNFETPKCAIYYRKSYRAEIEDEKRFMKEADGRFISAKAVVKPDKNAIRTALKNGEDVPGCVLAEYQTATIK